MGFYYVRTQQGRRGPYRGDELRGLAEQGRIPWSLQVVDGRSGDLVSVEDLAPAPRQAPAAAPRPRPSRRSDGARRQANDRRAGRGGVRARSDDSSTVIGIVVAIVLVVTAGLYFYVNRDDGRSAVAGVWLLDLPATMEQVKAGGALSAVPAGAPLEAAVSQMAQSFVDLGLRIVIDERGIRMRVRFAGVDRSEAHAYKCQRLDDGRLRLIREGASSDEGSFVYDPGTSRLAIVSPLGKTMLRRE